MKQDSPQHGGLNVSARSIRNPVPALMAFVLLSLAGLLCFSLMKVQNFPDLDLPTITVSAALPGAAPSQLETDVARKLEDSISTLQGVKHIYTKVQDGSVTLTAEFRLEKPVQEALDDVRSAVSRVRADLPGDPVLHVEIWVGLVSHRPPPVVGEGCAFLVNARLAVTR